MFGFFSNNDEQNSHKQQLRKIETHFSKSKLENYINDLLVLSDSNRLQIDNINKVLCLQISVINELKILNKSYITKVCNGRRYSIQYANSRLLITEITQDSELF